MSAWGCPHEVNGQCQRVRGHRCDPGMKGCILYGRFVWSNEAKNVPARRHTSAVPDPVAGPPPSRDGQRQ